MGLCPREQTGPWTCYAPAVVRRDGKAEGAAAAANEAAPCCTSPADESPVPVSAEAPGSRLPCDAEEIPSTKRSVKSPRQEGSNDSGRNKLKAVQASLECQPKGD